MLRTLVIIDINCTQCGKRIRIRASSEDKGGIEQVMCWNCGNVEFKVSVEAKGSYSVQVRTLNPSTPFKFLNRYSYHVWKETRK